MKNKLFYIFCLLFLSANAAEVNINGDDNIVNIQQIGSSNHHISVSIQGSVNSVGIQQTTTLIANHYLETVVIGGNNNITIQQRETAKNQTISVNGNFNTINTEQKGSGNHFLNLSITGNNHTAGITQDGAGNHNANIILDGTQPWNFTLNQNSNTGKNYNLPHTMMDGSTVSGSCYSVGGCTLIVNQQ